MQPASCVVIAEPGAKPGELDRTVQALKRFGIEVIDSAALSMHVGGEATKLPSPVRRDAWSGTVLRVRRVASKGTDTHAGLDWPHEVGLELAAWLVAFAPPQPVTVDVTVPERPHSAIPRWRRGLVDDRRIGIAVEDPSGEPLREDTRSWADHLIRTMASRWGFAAGQCDCCV